MAKKVEIQKGPISVDMKTYKNATYAEKSADRREQMAGLKSGITMTLNTPKQ
jgi:hypothetical protein